MDENMNAILDACLEVKAEVERARAKFPRNDHLLAALGEEYGELCQALLQNQGPERVREEAIEVACVAIRIATEGDRDFARSETAAMRLAEGCCTLVTSDTNAAAQSWLDRATKALAEAAGEGE